MGDDLVLARHPAHVAECAEGAARARFARGRLGHAVTVPWALAFAALRSATLCQVMASLVVITSPLNADMIPPNDLIS
jgi:hypothetical protein